MGQNMLGNQSLVTPFFFKVRGAVVVVQPHGAAQTTWERDYVTPTAVIIVPEQPFIYLKI